MKWGRREHIRRILTQQNSKLLHILRPSFERIGLKALFFSSDSFVSCLLSEVLVVEIQLKRGEASAEPDNLLKPDNKRSCSGIAKKARLF